MNRTEIQVLLIEDNHGEVLLLREALEQDALAVFHLTVAESLTEALEWLDRETFAVALLDLELSGSKGLDALLNFHQAVPHIPVVVLLPQNNEKVAQLAMQAGAQDYLVKRPHDLSFAGRAIRYTIERHKTKSELEAELRAAQARIVELEEGQKRLVKPASGSESEDHFARIFAASPSLMALTDIESGEYVEVNESFLHILGFNREEVIGKRSIELDLFVSPSQRVELLQRMAVQGSLRNEHVLIRAKSGEVRNGIFSAEYIQSNGDKLLLTVMNDVTERMRTEERWQLAFEGAGDGVWDWNTSTDRVFYSRQWKSMLGYGEDEIGDSLDEWISRIHPDDLSGVMDLVNAHLSGRSTSYMSEHRIRCKDGSFKWVLDRGKVIEWAESDKPLRVIGTHTDITERKQNEEKLIESEKRYQDLFENINSGVAVYQVVDNGQDFIFKAFNRAGEKIDNDRRERLIGKSIFEVRPGAKDFGLIEAMREVWQSGQAKSLSATRYKDNHLDGWYENFIYRISPSEIAAVFDDLTERKQAEEKLRESEQRYTLLFQKSDVPTVLVKLPEVIMVEVNEAAEKLTGFRQDELIGNKPAKLGMTGQTLYAEAIARFNAEGALLEKETCIITKTGEERIVIMNAHPLEIGGQSFAFTSLRDITDQKQAEERLRESEARFSTIFEASPVAIGISRLSDRKIINVNAAFSNLYGFTRGECIGRTTAELGIWSNPDDRQRFIELLQTQGHVSNLEAIAHLKSGQDSPVLVWGELVTINGEPCMIAQIVDISDRKQAEAQTEAALKKLRESEERYRGLMESLDSGVAAVDIDGKFLYMNEVAARQLGGTPQTLTGRTMSELFPETVASNQLAGVRQVIQEDKGRVSESLTIVHVGARWFRNSLQPIHDENGRVAYALLHATDIHELKSTQQDLQSRNKEMSLLLEAGRVLTGTLNATQIYSLLHRYISEVMPCEMLIASSYDPRTQLLHCEFLQTSEGPQDVSEFPPILLEPPGQGTQSQVIRTGESLLLPDYDQAFKTASTSYVFDEHGKIVDEVPEDPERARSAIIVPLRAEGEVVGALQIFSTELNAHTEDHLRFVEALAFRVSAALSNAKLFAELEQRVQARTAEVQDLYNNAPAGYHSLNAQGSVIMINQTLLNWLGYTREEALGLPFSEFMAPSSREIFTQKFSLLKQQGQLNNMEVEFLRKGGSTFPVLVNAAAIYDSAGNFVMSRTTVFDNTERKRAEEALRESYDRLNSANIELEKALRVKDEFLASMSHELRTPLTGILGLSEAMQLNTYGELSDRQRKPLQSINDSGNHLLSLINDILDLSKIEAGKLEVQVAPCILDDICQSSLQLIKGMMQQKHQYINYSASTEPVVLNADARRVKQILVNLLSNAVKFTPEYGELGLNVEPDAANRQVRLIIWDKGIGIKPENLEKLFKPFTQIDSSLAREYSGTGLGLSLVQRLAVLHYGSVEVESIFGEGSRFIVTLPWTPKLTASDGPKPESAQLTESQPEVDSPEYSHTILIADDNPVLVNMLADFLEAHHYRAVKAESGREVLEKITSVKPDLVLMDIQMPGMDGLMAIQHLRSHADPAIASIRIIAVTALAMRGDRERCLAAGANEYVSKPVKLKELQEMIEIQFGKR